MFFKRGSKTANKTKGNIGEELALKYLLKKNYRLLKKNYKTSFGEIDLIMRDGSVIVFIEVKWRAQSFSGMPYEAVNKNKQKTIINTAKSYIQKNDLYDFDCRFDIVSIVNDEVDHFLSAFNVS